MYICTYVHIQHTHTRTHAHIDTHTHKCTLVTRLNWAKASKDGERRRREIGHERAMDRKRKKETDALKKIQPGRKCTMDRESRLSTTFKCTRCSVLRVCPTHKFSQLHLCWEGYLKAVSHISIHPAHDTHRIRIRIKSPAWASLAAATCRHSLLAVHLLR